MPKHLKELSDLLGKIDDPKLIEKFLTSLFTPREVLDVASRWELVKLLDQGLSQRQISTRLGISLCKITRGSRELKQRNSVFRKILSLREDGNQP